MKAGSQHLDVAAKAASYNMMLQVSSACVGGDRPLQLPRTIIDNRDVVSYLWYNRMK